MLPSKLKKLIEQYCMGVAPTDNQMDEIMDLAISLSADSEEVAQYMEQLLNGPTKEELERIAKEEVERKAKAEAERKAKAEAERKAKAEAERKAKAAAERKAQEEAERKAKEETREKLNNILKKFFLAICALLFPPIVVIACNGGCGSILLSFVLWSLGWIPGVLYAFIVLYKTMSNK